jgi:hypothetical protein
MELARDLRIACRTAVKRPLFTLAIILTLALCIGVNSAIYSVIDSTLLRPLPYPEPERLAQVATIVENKGARIIRDAQDGRMWEAVRDHDTGFDRAIMAGTSGVNLSLGDTAEYVQQHRVSAGYFRVLGVRPAIGREFSLEEDSPGGPPVAILSDRLWRRAASADRAAIGGSLMLRGEPCTIVGVMPPGFQRAAVDVWTPPSPLPPR